MTYIDRSKTYRTACDEEVELFRVGKSGIKGKYFCCIDQEWIETEWYSDGTHHNDELDLELE